MKTRDYKVRLTFDRDVDKELTIEAKDVAELEKVIAGMDCGNGRASDYDILEASEEHEPTAEWIDWH